MPTHVHPSKEKGGVDVPTMAEFNALAARVASLESTLKEVMAGALKSGDLVSLQTRGEFVTWMDTGVAIQARATPFQPELQAWKIERR